MRREWQTISAKQAADDTEIGKRTAYTYGTMLEGIAATLVASGDHPFLSFVRHDGSKEGTIFISIWVHANVVSESGKVKAFPTSFVLGYLRCQKDVLDFIADYVRGELGAGWRRRA